MSATFSNKQHSSGYQIGAGGGAKMLVTILSLALVGYNAVHLHDYAMVMFVNDETWLVKEIAIRAAAVGLAFVEIIVGGVFVYLYRTSERINGALILTGLLALVVASMAVVAGNGSQQSKADVKSNHISSYNSQLSAVDSRMKAAEMERDIALREANKLKDANERAIAKDWANYEYSTKVSDLNIQKAGMQSGRPIQPIENGSTFHYIAITLFSILCSFGALFLSGYSAAFLKPLVAIPAFTLVKKLRHDWQSDGSDFQTVKHQVSPIGGLLSGLVGAQKLPADTRPTQQNTAELTSSKERAAENRPQPLATGRGGSNCVGVRTPPTDRKEGAKNPETTEYSDSHYQAIRAVVLNNDIKPTIRPIKAALVSQKVKFVDDKARQQKAGEILERLKSEGVIIDNPDQGSGGQIVAKYILNPDYAEQGAGPVNPSQQTGEPKQGDDIEVTCPTCGEVGLIERSVLQKSGGRLRGSCGHVYRVPESRWGVKPVVGAGIGISEEGINPIAGVGAIISK